MTNPCPQTLQCISAFPLVLLHKTCIDLILRLSDLSGIESQHIPQFAIPPIPSIGRMPGLPGLPLIDNSWDSRFCSDSTPVSRFFDRSTLPALSLYPQRVLAVSPLRGHPGFLTRHERTNNFRTPARWGHSRCAPGHHALRYRQRHLSTPGCCFGRSTPDAAQRNCRFRHKF